MNAKKRTDHVKSEPEVIDLGPEAVIDRDAEPAHAQRDESVSAEETKTETPFASAPPREEPSIAITKPQRTSWIMPSIALAAGLGLGGWFYRDYLASYFPTPEIQAMQQRLITLEQASASGNERITAQERLAEQLKGDIDAIEAQQAGVAADREKMSEEVTAANATTARIGREMQGLKQQVDAIAAAPQMSGTDAAPVDTALVDALNTRIASLEKDITSLKSTASASPDLSVLSQSLADLKAKVTAGTPFKDEVERIARMVPAAAGLDVLTTHAEAGIPNAAQLAQNLIELKPSLPAAPHEMSAGEPGYWESFTGLFDDIITVRSIDGADWQSVADKASALAKEENLAGAIALIDAATGERPTEIMTWRNQAEQRIKLEQALSSTTDAVTRQLAAKG
jgi:hypothetical protein